MFVKRFSKKSAFHHLSVYQNYPQIHPISYKKEVEVFFPTSSCS
ncbi:hypothetical protein SAIL_3490 [Streptococcus agalactiae ILRI112]|nr:hypothetical protein SAIL_3490 [Streptococcus agalactiae ILRI112]